MMLGVSGIKKKKEEQVENGEERKQLNARKYCEKTKKRRQW